jgi:hypothetical protein
VILRGLHLAIIQAAALLVPAPERAEWRAELCYVNRRITVFCLGSIYDAFWMNRNTRAPIAHRWFDEESPVKCVMLLAGLTALSVLLAFGPPGSNPAPPPRDGESHSVAPTAAAKASNSPSPADLESPLPNRMSRPGSASAPNPRSEPKTETQRDGYEGS